MTTKRYFFGNKTVLLSLFTKSSVLVGATPNNLTKRFYKSLSAGITHFFCYGSYSPARKLPKGFPGFPDPCFFDIITNRHMFH